VQAALDDMIAFAPSLLLTGATGRFYAVGLAEAKGIPTFLIELQPIIGSAQYPSILLDQLGFGDGCGCLNKLSHDLLFMQLAAKESSYGNPQSAERLFRQAGFGIVEEPLESSRIRRLFEDLPFSVSICVSPALFPRPADWPLNAQVTGALIVPLGTTMKNNPPSAELQRFVKGGSPPVYIGWGSMHAKSSAHMSELAVRALYLSGERGIVLRGWAGLDLELLDKSAPDYVAIRKFADEHVFIADDLPHEWLFQRCKLTVHHGGSGTTHCALRAGRPTIVTPTFLDQFSYARLVSSSGAGLKSMRLNVLTAKRLASDIKKAQAAEISAAAACLGEKMRRENGLHKTADAVEAFIAKEVATGSWRATFAANWFGDAKKMNALPSWQPAVGQAA